MKKFLAILLVCAFAFSFAACGGGSEESSAPAFSNANNSPKEEPSKEESSKTPSSSVSGDASEDKKPEASNFLTQYVSWVRPYYGTAEEPHIVNVKPTDAAAVALNKLNAPVAEGEIGAFTKGNAIQLAEGADVANFAVAVLEYNHTVFGYVKKEIQLPGSANLDTAVPEDGFILVIAKKNQSKINMINAAAEDVAFYPHGFAVNNELDAEIKKAATAPVLDGKVTAAEYGEAIWTADKDAKLFSYGQFEVNKYNVSADIYMTWDDEYLYLGAVVDTPDHFNTCTNADTSNMYIHTAIQVMVSAVSPKDEYVTGGAWDFYHNTDINNVKNLLRSYAYGYNHVTGESVQCLYNGDKANNPDDSKTLNGREGQITTYEVAIPWTDFGNAENAVEIKSGAQIGLGISINSGTEQTVAAGKIQALCMRDGGGIIGENDATKIPTITLVD